MGTPQPGSNLRPTVIAQPDINYHSMQVVELSLVIPTFNEQPNIAPLVAQLQDALDGTTWEALFVDDSTDGTDETIAQIGRVDPRVRLLHRQVNRGGLAGAVVDGLAEVRGTYICVLDADLQHPPSDVARLLAEARRTQADLVIASRYIPGGSTGGLAGPMRQFYSRGLKSLSRGMFPRRLSEVTDPLGGFFLVRRSIAQAVSLRPIGYKILLEILVRCPWETVSEVPYAFQPRQFGDSKADLRQGLQFLEHLRTLIWDCSPAFMLPRHLFGTSPTKAPDPATSA
jgi:dolichol-phosphate mannosyltransferase